MPLFTGFSALRFGFLVGFLKGENKITYKIHYILKNSSKYILKRYVFNIKLIFI